MPAYPEIHDRLKSRESRSAERSDRNGGVYTTRSLQGSETTKEERTEEFKSRGWEDRIWEHLLNTRTLRSQTPSSCGCLQKALIGSSRSTFWRG